MALQLQKRNYVMQGWEQPKILKLPQGETRWAPRRLPVDVGDVMMQVRMNDDMNKYVGEHVSKYAQGTNPYGEWGQPYKVNKSFRPPMLDPKFYQPLSRMPVKFDSVSAGPIVKDLYGKQVELAKVAPKTIIDKVCTEVNPTVSSKSCKTGAASAAQSSINLHLKTPRTSIPYHPSIPVHKNTGVPEIELDRKIIARPQMGIHAPFNHSDQSRDVLNMRTPMHVAVTPGYKAPGTSVLVSPDDLSGVNNGYQTIAASTNVMAPMPVMDDSGRNGYDLSPKIQTSAFARPTTNFLAETERQISDRVNPKLSTPLNVSSRTTVRDNKYIAPSPDVPIHTQDRMNVSKNTNVSGMYLKEGEVGNVELRPSLQMGEFGGKAHVPYIQEHQSYNRARETNRPMEFMSIDNRGQYSNPHSRNLPVENMQSHMGERPPNNFEGEGSMSGIRKKLTVQAPRTVRNNLDVERVIPVGTGRFVKPSL